jgi:hypothetical protein
MSRPFARGDNIRLALSVHDARSCRERFTFLHSPRARSKGIVDSNAIQRLQFIEARNITHGEIAPMKNNQPAFILALVFVFYFVAGEKPALAAERAS